MLNVQVAVLPEASVATARKVCVPRGNVERPIVRAVLLDASLYVIVPGSQGATAELVAPGLPSVYRQLEPAATTTGDAGQDTLGGTVLVTLTVKEHVTELAGEAASLAV